MLSEWTRIVGNHITALFFINGDIKSERSPLVVQNTLPNFTDRLGHCKIVKREYFEYLQKTKIQLLGSRTVKRFITVYFIIFNYFPNKASSNNIFNVVFLLCI